MALLALLAFILAVYTIIRYWVLVYAPSVKHLDYEDASDHVRDLIKDIDAAKSSITIRCRRCDVGNASADLQEEFVNAARRAAKKGVKKITVVCEQFPESEDHIINRLAAEGIVKLEQGNVLVYARVVDERTVVTETNANSTNAQQTRALAPAGSWVRVRHASKALLADLQKAA
ncbi:MAG: hypothetical protein AAB417_00495 [Patescibacteria group bacterium]